MTDVHEPEVRSYNMSQIRSKNTKPEMALRRYLFSKGIRYRLHDKRLPGRPDIVIKKRKTVIFINGCFWHGHNGCKYYRIPKTRLEWWQGKIERNKERDISNINLLYGLGYKVIVVWECELKPKLFDKTAEKVWKSVSVG